MGKHMSVTLNFRQTMVSCHELLSSVPTQLCHSISYSFATQILSNPAQLCACVFAWTPYLAQQFVAKSVTHPERRLLKKNVLCFMHLH